MKNLFVCTAAALLALTGCNENKAAEETGGAISLDATAARESRAAIARVSTLQGDAAGFKVWGTAADTPDVWYDGGSGEVIDGTNNHVFDAEGRWNFTTQVKWPSTVASYPMKFYAHYPATPVGLVMTSQTPDDLTATCTVQPTAAEQIDLLAARTETGAFKPSNDVLNITFKHLLAKVNYDFLVENGYEAGVVALTVENVANERVYDFLADNWTPTSAPVAANCTNGYLYLGQLDGRTAIRSAVTQLPGNDTDTPTYTAADNASLMLMPQNVPTQTWNPAADKLPGGKAHVRIVYRIGRAGADYIGYANASSHPDYTGSQAEADGYNGALFFAVGYPFTLDWEAGKGYTYTIALPGTSGGILLEANCFDDKGRMTDLPVPNLSPGDPMLGDGYIHLVPGVDDWNDMSSGDLL
jgi:hypothetical protein